ncbi:MAG: GNAT family N-acetyltransferase [Akkermansiaceae bacterium]|nr:GNAT family N-acetyltransferase [Armatimonadota bacterium]
MQKVQEITGGLVPARSAPGDADTQDLLTGVRLEKCKLTPPEADCLHEELKSTPNILGYTIPELLGFSEVLVATAKGENGSEAFAGACLCKDLRWNWTEISVVYVLPAFRGRGISTQLFTTAFAGARERKRHIFTLSRSPQVIHLMERLGMETSRSMWKAPLAVHLEMNWHMMSAYRWREAGRKMKMRKDDGYEFLGGVKRYEKTGNM